MKGALVVLLRLLRLSLLILFFASGAWEIEREALQISVQETTEDAHLGMIVQRYSGKGRKDKDPDTVLLGNLCNVNVSHAGETSKVVVSREHFVVNGADINPVVFVKQR